jgi:hypothetical protein
MYVLYCFSKKKSTYSTFFRESTYSTVSQKKSTYSTVASQVVLLCCHCHCWGVYVCGQWHCTAIQFRRWDWVGNNPAQACPRHAHARSISGRDPCAPRSKAGERQHEKLAIACPSALHTGQSQLKKIVVGAPCVPWSRLTHNPASSAAL